MRKITPRPFLCLTGLILLLLSACAPIREARLVDTPPAAPASAAAPETADAPETAPAPEAPTASEASSSTQEADFDATNAPLDTVLPFDPRIRSGQLDNGLRFYIRANQKPEQRAELRLAIDVGSVMEDDDQLGMAHFVEHMLFNGTENFAKHELVDYLQSIGMRFGADVNAYTGFDETVYMLTVPTDDPEILEKAFLVLGDWASRATFEDEEIEKERGVVLEEWRRGQGARTRLRDQQFPVIFRGSHYADRLPIGTPESIQNASPDAIRRFYKDWYRPNLMAAIAVGDFDADHVEGLIRKHLGGMKNPESARERIMYDVPLHDETLISTATDPEVTATQLTVLFKHKLESEGQLGDYRRGLVEAAHNEMINARLAELAQKPDSPFVWAFSGGGGFVRSSQVYQLIAQVSDDQVERGLAAVLTEIERVDRHGFTTGELERAKTNILRGYEQALREADKQPSPALAAEYLRNFLEDEPLPGIQVEAQIARRFTPSITLEEVNQLGRRWITDENRVIVVSGPEKADVQLPSDEQLLAVFSSVKDSDIAAWVDETKDQPLLAAKPTPGTVVEESQRDNLGVTEWHLSNGVRVVLRPTDFQNDQVVMAGFSPGGTSLVDDDSYISASLATALLGNSGVGEFSAIELGKAMSGKVAQVAPFLTELEEGFTAFSSPQDLETMFQLVYLHATAPRIDQQAVEAFLGRASVMLANRLSSPEVVYRDKWTNTVSSGHLRRQPPDVAMLDKIDPSRALEVYRERFADASDFTFILVGNFEVDAIRPLVTTYLGGLPSSNRQETWKDIGVESPDGVVRFAVKKGLEPKSQVQLLFHGDAEWSRQEMHRLRSLAMVLEIRMTELVREEMGLTYVVGVGGNLNPRPRGEYNFTIGWNCSPDEIEHIVKAIFAELKKVQDQGPGLELVEKVKENQRRKRQVDLKENAFWLGVLKTYYSMDLDPNLLLEHEELVNDLSIETLRDTARRYINLEQYVLGTLEPEATTTPTATDGAAEGNAAGE